MTKALLELDGLNIHFPTQHAVRDLSLTVGQGETLALVGESGCGKSATALAITRLLAPNARVGGRILLDGENLLDFSPARMRAVRGRAISMIFQEPMSSLNPVLSIGTQLGEVLLQHEQLSRQAARQRAIELLDTVRIPEPQRRIDDYPHNLSGGQRQRVMIAMAIACHPRLLIADEPTTALDVTVQASILELLDKLRRELSMGLLLITHDLGLVSQWADRVAVMFAGEKVEEAVAAKLFAHPEHAYTRRLLASSLHFDQELHYHEARLPDTSEDAEDLQAHVPTGVPAANEAVVASQAPLLKLEDVHVAYRTGEKEFFAVKDLSFEIRRGETLGLVGESGCGKSTLSKTILKLIPAHSGRILLEGQDITRLGESAFRPLRAKIQMVFQDPYGSLNPRHTVEDILGGVLRAHGVADKTERHRRIVETLGHVRLSAKSLNRYPHEFSGGQRQRIGIARALILRPALVICDEPVSALDVSIQAQVLNLLVDLKQELGLSYLFISHDLSVVRYISDRVLVMQDGRCVEQGDYRSIWNAPQHPYTRSLIEAVPGQSRVQVAAA
jgi:peptide/nickel transport system ATP-binding protein